LSDEKGMEGNGIEKERKERKGKEKKRRREKEALGSQVKQNFDFIGIVFKE